MENTVDDFFNEIDQIAPPKELTKPNCDWQECFDNSSGYTYYWNTQTDQVTWSMPEQYKQWKDRHLLDNSSDEIKKPVLFPAALPFKANLHKRPKDITNATEAIKMRLENEKECNMSSIEKLSLIPYDEESDSESEPEKNTEIVLDSQTKSVKENKNNNSDEDNIDLVTEIQNRAKILKDLGGELPPDVKKIVEQNDVSVKNGLEQKVKRDVSGFSLVAGYGDSEDEEDNDSKILSAPNNSSKIAISTLFPIPKPIDLNQFLETEKPPEMQEEIDVKAFHRKRRIAVEFNVEKPKNELNDVPEVDKQDISFKSETETVQNKHKISYPGFTSGGVMFTKVDIDSDKKPVEELNKNETMKKIEETHKTLKEKLTFLSEGREPVSPVQVIIIQMETLYEAMRVGSLTLEYLHNWLKQTCSELVKLEKEAAPVDWLLQWDRINKRYYYRNQQTGESQWDYPQPDIVAGDDAMDICTTPPPMASENLLEEPLPPSIAPQPPPPPRIKSPTPPPPPVISKSIKQRKKVTSKTHKSVVIEEVIPLPLENFENVGEPLPPGVDSPPEPYSMNVQTSNDKLGSELNSFYSDLAAMETDTDLAPPIVDTLSNIEQVPMVKTETPLKRKKKPKVKLVEGLAMKKKGVSKLVERWKNVQKDL
ncbi:hypothetical protein FQA39_LY10618 [Lamprigera yunnana]|nr:hypothetical protein FQA39_LY10618 [Lamprigera yunnana]